MLKEIDGFDINRLKITFTPNLPKSLQEKIDAFKALGGELSQKTTMSITDIVENPDKELEKIQDERNMEEMNNPALSDFDMEVLRRETNTEAE